MQSHTILNWNLIWTAFLHLIFHFFVINLQIEIASLKILKYIRLSKLLNIFKFTLDLSYVNKY